MKTIFFCARNIWDYLSHVKNVDRLNLPAVDAKQILSRQATALRHLQNVRIIPQTHKLIDVL